MIISFLRSSLITTSRLCGGRAWIEYNIGRRSDTNDANLKGSIIHQVLEQLALEKLNRQKGNASREIDPFILLEETYEKFYEENPGKLKDTSRKECISLLEKALMFQNGAYHPLNQNVLAVEHFFDFEIDKPWAEYSYEVPDGTLKGKLRLKGNCDLIIKEDENTLVCIDYKTSSTVKDWATDKEKTPDTIHQDPQLKFYFYALAHEFPQYENIIMTMYFIRLGKPLTAIFERSQLGEIEEWIRKGYNKLQDTDNPKFIDKGPSNWKCRFCQFSKTMENEKETTCKFFQRELKEKGMDTTMRNFADYKILSSYGSGASKSFKD